MSYTIHIPIKLPVRHKKQVTEVKPGDKLFLYVDRWNGFYDVLVDSVDIDKNIVTLTCGRNKHRLSADATVLVYENLSCQHQDKLSILSSTQQREFVVLAAEEKTSSS